MALTNILVFGDSGTGKTDWLKKQMITGKSNYVIIDLYGEYKEVRKTLIQNGYTVHTFCLAGSAVLYQETIHNLFAKERQALFLSAPQDAYADVGLARICVQAIMDAALSLPGKKQNVLCCLDDAAAFQKVPKLTEHLTQLSANGMHIALAFQKIWQVYELYGDQLLTPENFPTIIYTGGTEADIQEWIINHYQMDHPAFPLKEDQIVICEEGKAAIQKREKSF